MAGCTAPLHLIWDFDGTLYDSYPQMAAQLTLALAEFGAVESQQAVYALIKRTMYHGMATLAQRHALDVTALSAAFRRLQGEHPVFPPMAGLAACLADTAALGCRHYLFTHRDRTALAQLDADGLAHWFTDAVTRESGFADKPSPQAIVSLMDRHSFLPPQTVMIGDRDIDIQSGSAAGARSILLDPQGFYPTLEPTWRVQCLAQIPGILRPLLHPSGSDSTMPPQA